MTTTYDIAIVGGGPAGLSAALVAGRARRRALLLDAGTPRNAAAPAVHTFLTRDGTLPTDMRRIAHEQLRPYASVETRELRVEDIDGTSGALRLRLADGSAVHAGAVLITAGLRDTLPDIPGVAERWGRGVHHCVFCDGWEHRDGHWGLLAESAEVLEHVPMFSGWTRRLTLFAAGFELPDEMSRTLRTGGVAIEPTAIAAVEGEGRVEAVRLADGRRISIDALWLRPRQTQAPLVERMALALREDGAVQVDERGETSRPGVYAAGDATAGPMQQALLAAADGMRVAFGLVRASIYAEFAGAGTDAVPDR